MGPAGHIGATTRDASEVEWEALRADAPQPRYIESHRYLTHHVATRPRQSLDALVVRDGERIESLVPVIRDRYEHHWRLRLPNRTAHLASIGLSRALVPTETILGADTAAATRRAVDGLLEATSDADVVQFPQVRVGSRLDEDLLSLDRRRAGRWRAAGTPPERRRQVRFGDDFDAYLAERLDRKGRYNLRRRARLLHESGHRLTAATRPDEVDDFLTKAARVWAGSWHGARAAPIDPRSRLGADLGWAAEGGAFLGYLALLDDEPQAFLWGYLDCATFSVEKMGYVAEAGRLGPGSVLFEHMLRDVHERGVRLIDLGYGDYPYKRRWANAEVSTRAVHLVRPGLRPTAAFVPTTAYGHLRGAAVAGLTRAGLDSRARRLSSRALGR